VQSLRRTSRPRILAAALLALGWVAALVRVEAILDDPFLTRHEYFAERDEAPAVPEARPVRNGISRLPDGGQGVVQWVPTRRGALAWRVEDPTGGRGPTAATLWFMDLATPPPDVPSDPFQPLTPPALRGWIALPDWPVDVAATQDGVAALFVRRGRVTLTVVEPDLSHRSVALPHLHPLLPRQRDIAMGPDGSGGLLLAQWVDGQIALSRLALDGKILHERRLPAPTPLFRSYTATGEWVVDLYVELYVSAGSPGRGAAELLTTGGLIGRIMLFDARTFEPRVPPWRSRLPKVRDEIGDRWLVALALLLPASALAMARLLRRRAPESPRALEALRRRGEPPAAGRGHAW